MRCPKCQSENPDESKFCNECGTQITVSVEIPAHTQTLEAPKEELTRGATFANRYEIIEELGRGGMGRVYRVEDTKLNQEIAIKLIKPEVAQDKKTIERFRNELKLAREIAHRNVCRMYDLNEEKGTHFITMEYVRGEDLRSSIKRFAQLPIGKSISIAKQICEGLTEAHRSGIVHRDLKSSNIMIDKEGNVRIMDFGIARSLESKGITGAGVMIGTPEYMSPEQVEGLDVDQRSDIYSLGIILYEMVTGKVPFEGDTPFTVGVKQKSEIPKAPKSINAQIPDDLNSLILKCLEKDKEKRYQNAGEICTELTSIERGLPTTERIVPPKKSLTTREITVQFNLKRLFIPAVIAAAILIGAVILWKIFSGKESISVPSGKPSLAVMYFKNNTSDAGYDVWRTALSDSIITDLSQSKYINVLSGDKLYGILRELNLLDAKSYASEDLMRLAAAGEVNHILQGSLSKAGDIFRIEYNLQEMPTGKIIGSDRVEGKGEQAIFSIVDELTRKIKADFELSEVEIAEDIDREIEEITTSSPQAFKHYIEGRMAHNQGEYRKSIQSMEKAVALDPEFAMAYRSMAMGYSNMFLFSEKKKFLEKAFEHKDQLSDRERYLIEAEFYSDSEMTYDKAIEAYSKLLGLYPDDTIASTNMGNLYMFQELWDEAIERYLIQIRSKDKSFFPYINLADAYRAKGMYEKARELLEGYLQDIEETDVIRHDLSFVYFFQGKYDLALEESDKALSLNPDNASILITKGNIYACKEDFDSAEANYHKILERKEPGYHLYTRIVLGTSNLLRGKFENARQHYEQGLALAEKLGDNWWRVCYNIWSAYSYLNSGRPEEALRDSDEALRIAPDSNDALKWQRRAFYCRGRAFLAMSSVEDALKAAEAIKELVDKGTCKKDMRYYLHLLGMIEFERKNYSKAIEHFSEAVSLLPYDHYIGPFTIDRANFTEHLAAAFYESGDIERAQQEYEKILSFTTGKLYTGDVYARSLYWLGRIYELKDQKANAIEHYEKFLELWKDADPGVPEVEEASKRLAELRN